MCVRARVYFFQVRARKALLAVPLPSLERAVNWMLEHGDDDGIDGEARAALYPQLRLVCFIRRAS
jgi:uncharacterized UBP type Zn finger protein